MNNVICQNKNTFKKILPLIFLTFFFISLAGASLNSLGSFKQGENVRLRQVCQDATYINISSITYPNGSVAVSNIEMTSAGSGEFYYVLTDTNTFGVYTYNGISDGCDNTFAVQFELTKNGEPSPSGNVLLAFIIGFLLVSTFVVLTFMWIMNKFSKLNVTMNDIIISFSSYALFLGYYYFAWNYWGNETIIDILETFSWVFGFLCLFVVPVLLIITIIKNWGEEI